MSGQVVKSSFRAKPARTRLRRMNQSSMIAYGVVLVFFLFCQYPYNANEKSGDRDQRAEPQQVDEWKNNCCHHDKIFLWLLFSDGKNDAMCVRNDLAHAKGQSEFWQFIIVKISAVITYVVDRFRLVHISIERLYFQLSFHCKIICLNLHFV